MNRKYAIGCVNKKEVFTLLLFFESRCFDKTSVNNFVQHTLVIWILNYSYFFYFTYYLFFLFIL